jgi:hypothetical protein
MHNSEKNIIKISVILFLLISNVYCEVHINLGTSIGSSSKEQFTIEVNNEFKFISSYIDLEGSVWGFSDRRYFDSTYSKERILSYLACEGRGEIALSIDLGYIRNSSKSKIGPVLSFCQNTFEEPVLINDEYREAKLKTIYFGLGLINHFSFKHGWVFENSLILNGSLNSSFFIEKYLSDSKNSVDSIKVKNKEKSMTPNYAFAPNFKTKIGYEFKLLSFGCGFDADSYIRHYQDNSYYWGVMWCVYFEGGLIIGREGMRAIKNQIHKVFENRKT